MAESRQPTPPYALFGEAVDLAAQFIANWQHGLSYDAMEEWARQLHDELNVALKESEASRG